MLQQLDFFPSETPVPEQIAALIADGKARGDEFLQTNRAPAFVSCDFEPVYHALMTVRQGNLAPGNVFCEWGSGFGTVATMASLLGFESYGIEIQPMLVDSARLLAADYDARVDFVHGSFVPPGCEHIVEQAAQSDVFWLVTESDDAYADLELEVDDFDVVFAYPWPDEEEVITNLFDAAAATGAILLTYSYLDGIRIQRKSGRAGN